MSTIAMGVDLAKNVFSMCAFDASGRVIRRLELGREASALWLAQVVGTVVAIEACSGAHYWARRCLEHGLPPWIMAAQFVTLFRKRRTSKNDRNDAERLPRQRGKAVATEKATPEPVWIRSLDGRMPFGNVLVAIANKHARQLWAMLAQEVDYDPHACLNHPMHRQTPMEHAA